MIPLRQSKKYLPLTTLFAMALAIIIVMSLVQQERDDRWYLMQRSSYLSGPAGLHGMLLTLRELDYDLTLHRRPMVREVLNRYDAFLVIEPKRHVGDRDREQLAAWVRDGGRLLWVQSDSFSGQYLTDEMYDRLPYRPLVLHQRDSEVFKADHPLLLNVDQLTFEIDRTLDSQYDLGSPPEMTYGEPYDIDMPGDRSFIEQYAESPQKLIIYDQMPMLQVARYGEGRIIEMIDGFPLSNDGLDEADNARLLANIMWYLTEGQRQAPIGISEYHHGYVQAQSTMGAMLGMVFSTRWGMVVAYLGLVGLAWLMAGMFRFGPLQHRQRNLRRQRIEFAQAAGTMLMKNQGVGFLSEKLHDHYRQRLCQLLGLPYHVHDSRLERRAAQHSPQAEAAYRTLRELPEITSRRGSVSRIQRIHRLLEEIDRESRTSQ